MPRIEYQYHVFEFNRSPLTPLREEEFHSIRKDFENFLGNFLEEKEAGFRKLKNPHRFNWKIFLILLGSGLVLGFTGDYLGKNKHDNIGGVLDLLALIAGFSIIIQPVQWFLSFMKSSGFGTYEKKARAYYSWHRLLTIDSANYESYLHILSQRNEVEFLMYCRNEM